MVGFAAETSPNFFLSLLCKVGKPYRPQIGKLGGLMPSPSSPRVGVSVGPILNC